MNPVNNVDRWDGIYAHLPQVAIEPQELELLGSLKMDACVMFKYTGKDKTKKGLSQNVDAMLDVYRNASLWCNYTSSKIPCAFNVPLQLLEGVFLICGDCAWAGIQSKIAGGPCSLGQFTLLMPGNDTSKTKKKQTITPTQIYFPVWG